MNLFLKFKIDNRSLEAVKNILQAQTRITSAFSRFAPSIRFPAGFRTLGVDISVFKNIGAVLQRIAPLLLNFLPMLSGMRFLRLFRGVGGVIGRAVGGLAGAVARTGAGRGLGAILTGLASSLRGVLTSLSRFGASLFRVGTIFSFIHTVIGFVGRILGGFGGALLKVIGVLGKFLLITGPLLLILTLLYMAIDRLKEGEQVFKEYLDTLVENQAVFKRFGDAVQETYRVRTALANFNRGFQLLFTPRDIARIQGFTQQLGLAGDRLMRFAVGGREIDRRERQRAEAIVGAIALSIKAGIGESIQSLIRTTQGMGVDIQKSVYDVLSMVQSFSPIVKDTATLVQYQELLSSLQEKLIEETGLTLPSRFAEFIAPILRETGGVKLVSFLMDTLKNVMDIRTGNEIKNQIVSATAIMSGIQQGLAPLQTLTLLQMPLEVVAGNTKLMTDTLSNLLNFGLKSANISENQWRELQQIANQTGVGFTNLLQAIMSGMDVSQIAKGNEEVKKRLEGLLGENRVLGSQLAVLYTVMSGLGVDMAKVPKFLELISKLTSEEGEKNREKIVKELQSLTKAESPITYLQRVAENMETLQRHQQVSNERLWSIYNTGSKIYSSSVRIQQAIVEGTNKLMELVIKVLGYIGIGISFLIKLIAKLVSALADVKILGKHIVPENIREGLKHTASLIETVGDALKEGAKNLAGIKAEEERKETGEKKIKIEMDETNSLLKVIKDKLTQIEQNTRNIFGKSAGEIKVKIESKGSSSAKAVSKEHIVKQQ